MPAPLLLLSVLITAWGSTPCNDTLLFQWIRGHGGSIHSSLALRKRDGVRGRGVVANNSIEAGSRLFHVPVGLAMRANPDIHMQGSLQTSTSGNMKRSRKLHRLAATLLHHIANTASFYGPYLHCLPTECTSLFCWSNDGLTSLHDEDLLQQIESDRVILGKVRMQIQWLIDPIPSLQSWLWAVSIVYSRAFAVSGRYALVPFADMLNHDFHSGRIDIEEKRQISQNRSNSDTSKGWAAVEGWSKQVGPSGIGEGEEVCWCYQHKGATLVGLLNTFGFVSEVSVSILPCTLCRICSHKTTPALQQSNFADAITCFHITTPGSRA
jgi:hypothetical protein